MIHPIKRALAFVLERSGASRASLSVQRRAWGPFVRAVNYHDVLQRDAASFESHVRFYSQHFADASKPKLLDFLERGVWNDPKPGLALTFDDGLSVHAELVAPLLEAHGFTGWFFVPAGLVESTAESGDGPYMTWSQLRRLADRHVIGCHTMKHTRLTASLSPEEREIEIVASKRLLEERLERSIDVFCWVGGEEWSYSRESAEVVRRAGYRLSFMTNSAPILPNTPPLQLQRTNIEADYALALVRFQLSGVMDALYTPKRRRVNRLTSA